MQTIYKNEKKIKERIDVASKVLPVIERFNSVSKKDGIEPSIEHLKGFLSSGADYISNVLLIEAREDVKRIGVVNQKMRESLINDAISIDVAMYNNLQYDLNRTFGNLMLSLEDVQINKEGKPVLSKAFIQTVEDSFTVNLVTEDQKQFWSELNAFCQSFNRSEELAEKMGIPTLGDHFDKGYLSWISIEKTGAYCRIQPDANGFLCNNVMI